MLFMTRVLFAILSVPVTLAYWLVVAVHDYRKGRA